MSQIETQTRGAGSPEDHRTCRRMRALKGCRIVFNHENSTIDCMMRDRSMTGARLLLTAPYAAPDRFDVFIASANATVPARRIWQRGLEIGVAFEGAPTPLAA